MGVNRIGTVYTFHDEQAVSAMLATAGFGLIEFTRIAEASLALATAAGVRAGK
jgi:hypothetical protein